MNNTMQDLHTVEGRIYAKATLKNEELHPYQAKVRNEMIEKTSVDDICKTAPKGFLPYKAVHPGEILREEFMVEMDIMELSKRTGLKIKVIKPVTKCKAPVTTEIADRLSKAFGTSSEFWNNLQTSYDNWCLRKKLEKIKKNDRITVLRGPNLGKSNPISDMYLSFPRQTGKTLMTEHLKGRDAQLAVCGDAVWITPRFQMDEDGKIDAPITFNYVNPDHE